MRNTLLLLLLTILVAPIYGAKANRIPHAALQNLDRAIALADSASAIYFSRDMSLSRYYNPYTDSRGREKASVWMYTSSIEAVNAIMRALVAVKEAGDATPYDTHFDRYTRVMARLVDNLAYYRGTFTLTSYTQTREWTVYGVNRARTRDTAAVEGRENVYDDQQWLVRELLEAYRLTGTESYFAEAEYLTAYILDGWDCTLDADGRQNGGITWGPGYVSKHACSNGPMVSPLIWLSELYKGKDDKITYLYIAPDGSRREATAKKSDYYLQFACAVYDWQKSHLMRRDGVYYDMMARDDSGGKVAYETIDSVRYRKHSNLSAPAGRAYSYNSGTMLSGAADLYAATGEKVYLEDGRKLADASFRYFARPDATKKGYYSYASDRFSPWFNGVLMRGYTELYPVYSAAGKYAESFQKNLDYAWSNYLYKGLLPHDLLAGWNANRDENNTEGMFEFTYAAQYAVLARYELSK